MPFYNFISLAWRVGKSRLMIGRWSTWWWRRTLQKKWCPRNRSYWSRSSARRQRPLDFNDSNAANIINNWCADKTRGRINHIAATPMSGDMMMFLANAIYFKSKWQMEKRFRKEQTKPDDFLPIAVYTSCQGEKHRSNNLYWQNWWTSKLD